MSGEQISAGAQAWWLSARQWWAGQGQIPRRRPLAIATAAMMLIAVFSPSDGFTWTLLVGFFALALMWVRHFRRLRGARGLGLLGWLIVAGGGVALLLSGAMMAMQAFAQNFTTGYGDSIPGAGADPLTSGLALIAMPIAILTNLVPLALIGLIIWLVVRRRYRGSVASTKAHPEAGPIQPSVAGDPQTYGLRQYFSDPAQVGAFFARLGMVKPIGEINNLPQTGLSEKSWLLFALGKGTRYAARRYTETRKKPGEFINQGVRYAVPRVIRTQDVPAGLEVTFSVPPFLLPDAFDKARETMKSLLALAHGVSVSQSGENIQRREIVVTFKVRNPLAETVPYTVDVTQAISPDEPMVVGPDEAGNVIKLIFAKIAHMLIAGATRSGKSVFTYALINHLLRMGDSVRLLVADPNDTTVAPFSKLLSWWTSDPHPAEPTKMLKWAHEEMIRRQPILRQMRRDKIEHFSPELPLIVIIIDEAAQYMRSGDKDASGAFSNELLAIVSQGAKYGIRLVLITQRPDSTILDTSIRAQLSVRVCFNLLEKETAKMMFPDLDDPNVLLRMQPGEGMFREVGGEPRRFRSVFLEDHWVEAEKFTHALPAVVIDDETPVVAATSNDDDLLYDPHNDEDYSS